MTDSVDSVDSVEPYKRDCFIHYSSHKTMVFPRLIVASFFLVMVQYSASYDNSVYVRALRTTLPGRNGKAALMENMDKVN